MRSCRERVHPGNKEFNAGDHIKRPQSGSGQGGTEGSENGEGQDEFIFELTREEFLQFFFEDLELPNLVKTKLSTIKEVKKVRAGYKSDGTPSNINVIRSLRGAMGRRIALRSPYQHQINELERKSNDC